MSNEELLEQISNGDEAALTKLYLMNTGLVKDRALPPMSPRFWMEPCGGIWNAVWEHFLWTGTAWG